MQLFSLFRKEEKHGVIRSVQAGLYLQLVGDKEHRLAFGKTHDSFMEDMRAHTSIDSTERIIQENYGPFTVQGSGQAHSLTLPSTQVCPSLSNLQQERYKMRHQILPCLLMH